jgi:hypothetical protein
MVRSFWKMFAPRTGRTPPVHRRPTPSFRPSVFVLEDRSLPSVVTNLMDSGPGSLRNAVGAAVSGETITFDPLLSGTITLTTGEIASSTANLTITGPGAGTLTISGGDAAHTTSSRIFNFGDTSSATISGLTFINGKSAPPTLFLNESDGGAIASTGTLTVNNCIFNNNIATDPTVVARGGAIWNNNHLTLNNDTFTNNSASSDMAGVNSYGGAVAGSLDTGATGSAALTANNCYFSNNGALTGGALAAFDNLSLSSDFFDGNGGPLDPMTHLFTVGNSGGNVFSFNAGLGTPAINVTIDKTTIAGGVANNGGGLFYGNGIVMSLTNSTVYGNTAALGGGIFQNGGAQSGTGLTIKSSTITANTVTTTGGGIYNAVGPNVQQGPIVLQDTIVAGNTQGTPFYGFDPNDVFGGLMATFTVDGVVTATSDHNIIGHGRGMTAWTQTITGGSGMFTGPVDLRATPTGGGNQVGTEASHINAGLSDLRNNGGPAVGANGAFNLKTVALLANSPAIGAGDPALAGTTDQNGTVRSATPNVGAIEYVANTADHVIFLTQPTATPAGGTISSFVVEVVDQFGNLVNSDSTDSVTLSIGVDPSGGTATLSGTLTLTFTNGVATFTDLSIDTAGTGYTLHATASGLTPDLDSNPFDIT